MSRSIPGHAVRRREDPALIMGSATLVADVKLPGCLEAAFVRSPFAHARIRVDYEKVQVVHSDTAERTASLVDYLMPTAAEMPKMVRGRTVTPSPLNALGAKGIGESGTIGSTPAVQNAVVDALAHLGVRHIDMPLAPGRVWRAIQEARSRAGSGASCGAAGRP